MPDGGGGLTCRGNQIKKIDDIRHYQRILKILSETHRIMQTITMTLQP
jgi:hypothetical protein